MPYSKNEERDIKNTLNKMFMDTVNTFKLISENSETIFHRYHDEISNAINEYIEDFYVRPKEPIKHPEYLIYNADFNALINAGFYGHQLKLKLRQVTEVNENLRKAIISKPIDTFIKIFKRWIDVINNFIGSLVSATGAGEALKEIKDCIRDELDS